MKPVDELAIGTRIVTSSDQVGRLRCIAVRLFHHHILWQEELTVHPFYEKYSAIIPGNMRADCKKLLKRVKARDVEYFRNSCIGHIWYEKKSRPLHNSEIEDLLNKITLNHVGNFMKWINDSENNSYPNTVVSIVERLRDDIVAQYGVGYEEVLEK